MSENISFLYPQLVAVAGGKNNNKNEDQEDENDDENDFVVEEQNQNSNNNNQKESINSLLSGGDEDTLAHHLFDETLIPPEWYKIASIICKRAFGGESLATAEHGVAIAKLASLRTRHRQLADSFNSTSIEGFVHQIVSGNDSSSIDRSVNFFGPNEIEFIIDEIISFGATRSRRTYRKMTDARFFSLVTGHTFLESRKAIAADRKHHQSSAVLCIGDIIEGVPESISISNNRLGSDNLTLRLQGSKGLTLLMRVEELPSELSGPLRDNVRQIQNLANVRGLTRPPMSAPVPLAMKSMTICGRLQSVDLATGDARVSYEANPDSDIKSRAFTSAIANRRRASDDFAFGNPNNVLNGINNNIGGLESSHSSRSGAAAASIKSVQLVLPSRGNALRAASHILYKNISNESAKTLLADAEIGEVLIRPCSQPKSGDITVVVKAGADREALTNIPVFEERRTNGVVYYRLVDTLTAASSSKSLEFSEIDHLLERYIRPMGRRYRELANHRRFATSREQVLEHFEEQFAVAPRAFVYNIIEVPNHARCVYSIICRAQVTGKDIELRLCATGGQLLVENPRFVVKGGKAPSNIKDLWLRCDGGVERMISQLKELLCDNKQRQ